MFWSIAHLPQAASPVNEWKYFSLTVQLLDPNEIGLSLAPCFDRSKRQTPVEASVDIALIDSSSSAGCINIHHMPSLLQSVFKKVGLVVSNLARTGEEVIHTLRSAKSLMSAGVQADWGIGFL